MGCYIDTDKYLNIYHMKCSYEKTERLSEDEGDSRSV